MTLINKFILALAATLLAGTVVAQTSVPNTFEADTTASATEVNANFTALVNAVNALSTRVDALEADPSVTLEDLVGRTYCITFQGVITGVQTGFARVGPYIGSGTLAITSTTQGVFSTSLDKEHEMGWFVGGEPVQLSSSITNNDYSESPQNVTITGLSNGVLSLADFGNFNLSSDGSAFTLAEFTSEDASESESTLIIGIRCD